MMTGVAPAGIAPATNRVKAGCSGSLSYGTVQTVKGIPGSHSHATRGRAGALRWAIGTRGSIRTITSRINSAVDYCYPTRVLKMGAPGRGFTGTVPFRRRRPCS